MITIDYKNETLLIKEFLKEKNISVLEKKSFFSKLKLQKERYADIYFHFATLDKEVLKKIKHAKLIIVSSLASKKDLLASNEDLDENKIKVVYPAINEQELDEKESKKLLCEELNFDEKNKIIFFTAENFKKNGAREFINIASSLHYKYKQIIIEGSKEEIENLKFQIKKEKLSSSIIFLQDYKNKALLYSACDIFLFPTSSKSFSSNVIKAMFHKCIVFVCISSTCREIVDVYSTMQSSNDGATVFKINAVLCRENDIKLIKEQNHEKAKEFLIINQIEKLRNLSRDI